MRHAEHMFLLSLFLATVSTSSIYDNINKYVYKNDNLPIIQRRNQMMPFHHIRHNRINIAEGNVYINAHKFKLNQSKDNEFSEFHDVYFKNGSKDEYKLSKNYDHKSNGGERHIHNNEILDHPVHENVHKTVTIIKKIAMPYPVEKAIQYPVNKISHPVKVPVSQPYAIEKKISYPVKVLVKVPIEIPLPIPIIKKNSYPIKVPMDHRPVPVKVYVPKPYPIEKKIQYKVKIPISDPFPVERKIPAPKIPIHVQPYPVEKVIHYPVKITMDKPMPLPVLKPYPISIAKPVPSPVEKPIPISVKVHVERPAPIAMDKPMLVKVKVPDTIPRVASYSIEKKIPYFVKNLDLYR